MLEEMSFHLYPRGKQLMLLGLMVILENLGYRQLNTWWRLIGLWRWLTQKEASWGAMKRKGVETDVRVAPGVAPGIAPGTAPGAARPPPGKSSAGRPPGSAP